MPTLPATRADTIALMLVLTAALSTAIVGAVVVLDLEPRYIEGGRLGYLVDDEHDASRSQTWFCNDLRGLERQQCYDDVIRRHLGNIEHGQYREVSFGFAVRDRYATRMPPLALRLPADAIE